MDPLALALQAANQKQADSAFSGLSLNNFSSGVGSLIAAGADQIFDQVTNLIQTGTTDPTRPRPTLGSMAFTVEMYWSGWVFRGYFEDFTLDESADHLGMFDYSMNFAVTQKRGMRLNFMPWHKSATNGPSNSSVYGGVPYSFGYLMSDDSSPADPGTPNIDFAPLNIQKTLQGSNPQIVDARVKR
jgi:hypothetical protein